MNIPDNSQQENTGSLQQRLSDTERNYQEIFNATREAIFIDDASTGKILDVNKAMLNMYGYDSKEEVLNGNIGDLSANIHPYTEEKAQENIRKAIHEGPQLFEWLAKKKHGDTFWVEVSLSKTEIGGKGRILAVVRDIDDAKKSKDAFKRQQHLFEQMFQQASISTQVLDNQGWCVRINPKLSELFGVEPQHIEGKLYNIFQDEAIIQGGVLPHLHKVFNEGIPTSWEVLFDIGIASESQQIQVREKKKAWFRNWAFPIFDKNGQLQYVIIQHTNIDQEKQTWNRSETATGCSTMP
jgi:PAS domain S-box-containing protein